MHTILPGILAEYDQRIPFLACLLEPLTLPNVIGSYRYEDTSTAVVVCLASTSLVWLRHMFTHLQIVI